MLAVVITAHIPLTAPEARRKQDKLTEDLNRRCALCFLCTPVAGWWRPGGLRAVPSCAELPRRGTADVGSLAFLSAATPQAQSFLELRTPSRQENHPSLALSHTVSIQKQIGAGGKGLRSGRGAPGAGLWDSYCDMSHTYYIRVDQEHSKATQVHIRPHTLGRGCQRETCPETRPGISTTAGLPFSSFPFCAQGQHHPFPPAHQG